ncbi:MAG TPA: glycosyltransferase family 2 protein [Luteibacter sp.]|uniref:glycosyltransferase family 2 protein n=1 Tax=Luteibacter sp. TaxID=1886636 RepID=UPI002CF46373|nr:glycosyltransferase family 2 protein [Luteibacter sp.]HVI57048.1 glycosyltransferase family 2 protein [Luteibacter sp.]
MNQNSAWLPGMRTETVPAAAAISTTIEHPAMDAARIFSLMISQSIGVSVIVPALNEEVVIRATIGALLASDVVPLEVIAVDDGSSDGTAAVLGQMALEDPRVKCIRLPCTMGKANALNEGVAAAGHELVVTVDADTIVDSGFIRAILAPLREGRADAVAGNIKVGNRRHFERLAQARSHGRGRFQHRSGEGMPTRPATLVTA